MTAKIDFKHLNLPETVFDIAVHQQTYPLELLKITGIASSRVCADVNEALALAHQLYADRQGDVMVVDIGSGHIVLWTDDVDTSKGLAERLKTDKRLRLTDGVKAFLYGTGAEPQIIASEEIKRGYDTWCFERTLAQDVIADVMPKTAPQAPGALPSPSATSAHVSLAPVSAQSLSHAVGPLLKQSQITLRQEFNKRSTLLADFGLGPEMQQSRLAEVLGAVQYAARQQDASVARVDLKKMFAFFGLDEKAAAEAAEELLTQPLLPAFVDRVFRISMDDYNALKGLVADACAAPQNANQRLSQYLKLIGDLPGLAPVGLTDGPTQGPKNVPPNVLASLRLALQKDGQTLPLVDKIGMGAGVSGTVLTAFPLMAWLGIPLVGLGITLSGKQAVNGAENEARFGAANRIGLSDAQHVADARFQKQTGVVDIPLQFAGLAGELHLLKGVAKLPYWSRIFHETRAAVASGMLQGGLVHGLAPETYNRNWLGLIGEGMLTGSVFGLGGQALSTGAHAFRVRFFSNAPLIPQAKITVLTEQGEKTGTVVDVSEDGRTLTLKDDEGRVGKVAADAVAPITPATLKLVADVRSAEELPQRMTPRAAELRELANEVDSSSVGLVLSWADPKRDLAAVAREAKLALEGQGVAFSQHGSGANAVFRITPDSAGSKLNRWAYHMQQKFGVALEFDATTLSSHGYEAGFDGTQRRICLSMDAIARGRATHWDSHEVVHLIAADTADGLLNVSVVDATADAAFSFAEMRSIAHDLRGAASQAANEPKWGFAVQGTVSRALKQYKENVKLLGQALAELKNGEASIDMSASPTVVLSLSDGRSFSFWLVGAVQGASVLRTTLVKRLMSLQKATEQQIALFTSMQRAGADFAGVQALAARAKQVAAEAHEGAAGPQRGQEESWLADGTLGARAPATPFRELGVQAQLALVRTRFFGKFDKAMTPTPGKNAPNVLRLEFEALLSNLARYLSPPAEALPFNREMQLNDLDNIFTVLNETVKSATTAKPPVSIPVTLLAEVRIICRRVKTLLAATETTNTVVDGGAIRAAAFTKPTREESLAELVQLAREFPSLYVDVDEGARISPSAEPISLAGVDEEAIKAAVRRLHSALGGDYWKNKDAAIRLLSDETIAGLFASSTLTPTAAPKQAAPPVAPTPSVQPPPKPVVQSRPAPEPVLHSRPPTPPEPVLQSQPEPNPLLDEILASVARDPSTPEPQPLVDSDGRSIFDLPKPPKPDPSVLSSLNRTRDLFFRRFVDAPKTATAPNPANALRECLGTLSTTEGLTKHLIPQSASRDVKIDAIAKLQREKLWNVYTTINDMVKQAIAAGVPLPLRQLADARILCRRVAKAMHGDKNQVVSWSSLSAAQHEPITPQERARELAVLALDHPNLYEDTAPAERISPHAALPSLADTDAAALAGAVKRLRQLAGEDPQNAAEVHELMRLVGLAGVGDSMPPIEALKSSFTLPRRFSPSSEEAKVYKFIWTLWHDRNIGTELLSSFWMHSENTGLKRTLLSWAKEHQLLKADAKGVDALPEAQQLMNAWALALNEGDAFSQAFVQTVTAHALRVDIDLLPRSARALRKECGLDKKKISLADFLKQHGQELLRSLFDEQSLANPKRLSKFFDVVGGTQGGLDVAIRQAADERLKMHALLAERLLKDAAPDLGSAAKTKAEALLRLREEYRRSSAEPGELKTEAMKLIEENGRLTPEQANRIYAVLFDDELPQAGTPARMLRWLMSQSPAAVGHEEIQSAIQSDKLAQLTREVLNRVLGDNAASVKPSELDALVREPENVAARLASR